MKKKYIVLIMIFTTMLLLASGWLWFSTRSREANELVDIEWSQGGEPMTVQITLRDAEENPLPGVRVDSVSYSGRAGNESLTDKAGSVVIRPGERELIGIDVNGVHVFERANLFSPSIDKGLKVIIVVKNLKQLKIDRK
jgi:hypothetical protein